MFFKDLLIAFLVAALLSLLVGAFSGARPARYGGSAAVVILFYFMILFFTSWAGGLWLRPFGPPLWGAYWLPFVLVGLLMALMLAAFGRRAPQFTGRSTEPGIDGREPASSTAAFGLVFWIVIAALLTAIVTRYFF
jgi:hypothetical protein